MSDAMMARTASGTGTSQTIDTLHVRTDSTGTASFRYVASQFGGVERIRARLLSDTTKWDTLSVVTRVPGLIRFSGAGNYDTTGRTDEHPDNHYFVSQIAIDSLILAANKFAIAEWNTEGTMKLNDMSLRLGGMFDIKGRWRTPHSSHRVGRSVDIQNLTLVRVDTVSPYTGQDTSFTIPKVKFLKDFVNFMEVQMGNWHFENEGQDSSNVFGRTRRYAHFEWREN